MITKDKRAFKRIRRKFRIEYKSHVTGKQKGSAVTENISAGGVFFLSKEQFLIGELIDCSIFMGTGNSPGMWIARVVRCENSENTLVDLFGIAAEFVEAKNDSEKKLRENLV